MAHIAWYYNTGEGTYYWTESWTLSVTEFANKVSQLMGKEIKPGDTSAVIKKSSLEAMKRRASTLIYVSQNLY